MAARLQRAFTQHAPKGLLSLNAAAQLVSLSKYEQHGNPRISCQWLLVLKTMTTDIVCQDSDMSTGTTLAATKPPASPTSSASPPFAPQPQGQSSSAGSISPPISAAESLNSAFRIVAPSSKNNGAGSSDLSGSSVMGKTIDRLWQRHNLKGFFRAKLNFKGSRKRAIIQSGHSWTHRADAHFSRVNWIFTTTTIVLSLLPTWCWQTKAN